LPDPNLRKELAQANKTAGTIHIAMLCEPVLLVVLAIMLRQAGVLRTMPAGDSLLGAMSTIFVLLSVAGFAGFFAVWRIMFSPNRIAPNGAAASKIRTNYISAQLCLNVLATTPSIFGFVLFVFSGGMIFLVVVAAVGIALMLATFPRPGNLETIVAQQAAKAKESSMETIEEWEQYKSEHNRQKEA
jgi:hypothetical protein